MQEKRTLTRRQFLGRMRTVCFRERIGEKLTFICTQWQTKSSPVVGLQNSGQPRSRQYSTRPPGTIERLEIVLDGGSSKYGSDTVARVMNFVTRRKFNGVMLDARYGFAENLQGFDANVAFCCKLTREG